VLSATDECPACGGRHQRPVGPVTVGKGVVDDLVEFLDQRRWSHVVLVSDVNTDEAFANVVANRLNRAGYDLRRVSFPQHQGLLADASAVDNVRAILSSETDDVAVAVGSGTLNDITRYATFAEGTPYVSVPTAASMDGYASAVAAMQFGGMKVSYPTHAPVAIFAELDVVVAAPPAMTSWGLDDLLGKATAHFDWLLSNAVTGEPFCPVVEDRVLRPLNLCLDQPETLLAGDEPGIRTLLSGLIESGVAMAMIGSSRPASGAEHHASHFWDLLAYRGLRPHAPHGLQVGYATRLMMDLQRRALDYLDDEMTTLLGQDPGDDEKTWLGTQSNSDSVSEVRTQKQAMFANHAAAWPPEAFVLNAVRGRLEAVVAGFEKVTAALDAAAIPATTGFMGIDGPMLSATLRYANRLRSRFTTLDFLESQGHLPEMADTLLKTWQCAQPAVSIGLRGDQIL
jgi:glycerol-1-phosphate dehydrogenase [NAD(P)+]